MIVSEARFDRPAQSAPSERHLQNKFSYLHEVRHDHVCAPEEQNRTEEKPTTQCQDNKRDSTESQVSGRSHLNRSINNINSCRRAVPEGPVQRDYDSRTSQTFRPPMITNPRPNKILVEVVSMFPGGVGTPRQN